jgi:RND family efflux transporter MFP subunit
MAARVDFGVRVHSLLWKADMKKNRVWIVLGAVGFAGVLAWWIGKTSGKVNGEQGAEQVAAVPAAVARVQRGSLENSLTIAGEFKPFQDVDLHAKVTGYIRTIYVDVGDHVNEGQVVAVLEIPELAAELAGADAAVRRAHEEIRRAAGDVQRAESAHAAAHGAYERLQQAATTRPGIVAQQEIDDTHAKDLEGEAQVSSVRAALSSAQQQLEMAQASQKQYGALANYTRIVAPFAGVITSRSADTGSLIAAGTSSSAQSMAVVHLAQISKLRLVLPIPESMAGQIRVGNSVKVHVQALNQDIVGKVSRFAGSLDLQTRTMETEIDFDNRNGKLLPGMYAETTLTLAGRKEALLAPLEAVAQNGNDATALVVNADNVIEERHVKLGMQGTARVEVLSGLREGDRVIIGNRSQFRSGEKVAPKEMPPRSGEAGGAS